MKKFKFLVKYGLKKRVWRKAFLISNIFVAILIMGIINIPTIISLFSSDEEIKPKQVLVINETDDQTVGLTDDLLRLFNLPYENDFFLKSGVVVTETQTYLDTFWEQSEVDILILFVGNINFPEINIYSKDVGLNGFMIANIQLLINEYQIDNYMPPTFVNHFAPDYEDPGQSAMISSITTILVLPLFILITMATQFIGVDIIEEKSTKAIETIIASVPAKIHFLSKITSSILFIMIQGFLLVLFGALGSLVGGAAASSGISDLPVDQASLLASLVEIFPNWRLILVITLLFVIVGTLFYLVISSLFASMATTQEDYQQFQSPIMLMLLAGFYIGIFAPLANAYGFMKVMAFVPIFSPMVAPIAYASGILSTAEAIIAFLAVVIFTVGALYLVAPVYRVAILNYDQTKFFKRIVSNFKKAFAKNGKAK